MHEHATGHPESDPRCGGRMVVPDEALILSALSDGARHPMLVVAAAPCWGRLTA